MLDVLSVQEIELAVGLRAVELEAQFQARFNAPIIRAQMVQAVLEQPELAAQLKREQPDEYAKIERQVKRMQQILKGA